MIQRILAICGLGALGLVVAGCLSFGADQPAAPQQQQGPVVVPVIDQSSDNSGWFVLITFVIIGLFVAIGLAIRAWLKEHDKARDAREVTNQVLAALPEDIHREVTYALGYQPDYRVARTSVESPSRRAIGGPR